MIYLILLLSLILRLYQLDNLPGEMWGDVSQQYRLVEIINKGKLFIDYRFGGDGPLFAYFAALLSKFFGLSFFSLKLTSVLIGLSCVYTTYLLTEAFFKNKKIAYIASYFMGVSFWSLSFSRQAKPYILVPLFVSLFLIFWLKRKKIYAGLMIGLGMYSQSAFWGTFLLSFISIPSAVASLIVTLPIFYQMIRQPDYLFSNSSYLGEKFVGSLNLGYGKFIYGLLLNVFRNLASLNFEGDGAFRHTIPNQPHLDPVIGAFFLIGLVLLFKWHIVQKKMKNFYLIIIAFFVIQIPSILDVKNVSSNPNMGRMIGIIPILYMISAYGLYQTANRIKNEYVKKLFFILCCLTIVIFNFYSYFYEYPKTLPNKNTPFGKIIAAQIDRYPMSSNIILINCCWGDWGQPEPESISFELKNKRKILLLNSALSLSKDVFSKKGSTIVITAPNNYITDQRIKKSTVLQKGEWIIANIYEF